MVSLEILSQSATYDTILLTDIFTNSNIVKKYKNHREHDNDNRFEFCSVDKIKIVMNKSKVKIKLLLEFYIIQNEWVRLC